MKTYSTKAAAKKGAKRQNLDVTTLEFLQNNEERWYWEEASVEELVEEYEEAEVIFETNTDLEDKLEAALDLNDKLKRRGIKIEKERPEQNGIIRPSTGGRCRQVWDFCDSVYKTGKVPMPKDMREWAIGAGVNENNAIIEMYQWRKFHSIKNRK